MFKRVLSMFLSVVLLISALPLQAMAEELPVETITETEHEHSYVSELAREVSCSAEGEIIYTCDCGDSYTEIVPAAGHSYEEGFCLICGEADPDYQKAESEEEPGTEEKSDIEEKLKVEEEPETKEESKPEEELEAEEKTEPVEEPTVETVPVEADETAGAVIGGNDCGEVYNSIQWSLNNGVLTFTGAGTIARESWWAYKDQIKQVVIPYGIVFEYYRFEDCPELTRVDIGMAVIPDNFFFMCPKLKTVNLASTVVEIGDAVFYGCDSLVNVTIPDSVVSMGDSMFGGCYNLESAKLPKGLTNIPDGTFSNCSKLKSITIPSGVTSIGDNAFYWCESLTNVELPKGLKTIGLQAFSLCEKVTEFKLPEGLESIGKSAFSNCYGWKVVEIPASVSFIGERAFEGGNDVDYPPRQSYRVNTNSKYFCHDDRGVLFNKDKTRLLQAPNMLSGSYTIPSTVKEIDTYAFYHCENVTQIVIPEGVTTIGQRAFEGCRRLARVSIPSSLKVIPDYCFSKCALEEIILPEGLERIGKEAFYYYGSGNYNGNMELIIPASVRTIGASSFMGYDGQIRKVIFMGDAPAVERQYSWDYPPFYYFYNTKFYYQPENTTFTEAAQQALSGGYGTWEPVKESGIKLSIPEDGVYDEYLLAGTVMGFGLDRIIDTMQVPVHVEPSEQYQNVSVKLSLPEGFSFDKKEYVRETTVHWNMGLESFVTSFPDIYPIYIDQSVRTSEYSLKAEIFAEDMAGNGQTKTQDLVFYRPLSTNDKAAPSCPNITNADSYTFALDTALGSGSTYNKATALLCATMADLAYSRVHLQSFLVDNLGFYDFEFYGLEDEFDLQINEIGRYYATKKILVDGEIKNLVYVICRGTPPKPGEWISNLITGEGLRDEHYGFNTAAGMVKNELKKYCSKHEFTKENTIIVVTGHSRGAAVSNLIGQWLNSSAGLSNKENTCAYTFATPTVARGLFHDAGYRGNENIFNYVNYQDAIRNSPSMRNFGRYGSTTIFAYETTPAGSHAHVDDYGVYLLPQDGSNFTLSELVNAILYMTDVSTPSAIISSIEIAKTLVNVGLLKQHYERVYPTGDFSFGSAEVIDAHNMKVYYKAVMKDAPDGDRVAISYRTEDAYRYFTNNVLANVDYLIHKFKCPINLYVYDAQGNQVASIVDKVVTNTDNSLLVYVDGDSLNVGYLEDNADDYSIRLEGYDDGTMTHCIITSSEGEITNTQHREDIPVTKGGTLELNAAGYVAVEGETEEDQQAAYEIHETEEEMDAVLSNLDHIHVYGGWVQTVAPGCETEGEQARTCGDCGKAQTKVLEALGHDYYTAGGETRCHRCDLEWSLVLSSNALYFESTEETQSVQLTAQVQPAEWESLVTWRVEPGGEAVVQVDDDGNVTPLGEGTAYILAAVDGGEVQLEARCRVDVGQGLQLTAKNTYVVSGKTLQMKAFRMPENVEEPVTWSLSAGTEYASINSKGLVTAKKNITEAAEIEVMAVSKDGTRVGAVKVAVLPASAKLSILHNGEVWGQTKGAVQTIMVDRYEKSVITLDAWMEYTGYLDNAVWSTSSSAIAKVSDGLVTLVKPGTVTITAKDANGIAASVKLQVIYLDAATKLTAGAEIPAMGLQHGYRATMEVFGTDKENPLPVDELTFSIPANQQTIAKVDGSGMIIAGDKAGTATVTAAIKNDPLKRKVTLKVKVIAVQTAEMILKPEAEEPAQIIMLDVDGNVTKDTTRAVRYQVYLDKDHVQSGSYKFTIQKDLIGKKADGSLVAMTGTAVTWATTDSRMATVAANKDGSATVTVKAKTDGACVITGTSKDLAKVQSCVMIYVRDYAPRLESTSLTLNTKMSSGVSTRLVESDYGEDNQKAKIDAASLKLYEYDSKTKKYLETESDRLEPSWADGILTISHQEKEIKNGSIKLRLVVGYGEGQEKEYFITLKVANSEPAITIKQDAKINLHTGSQTNLTVTAKNAVVTNVVLDTETTTTFCQTGYANGVATLGLTDTYKENGVLDAKVDVLVKLEGYTNPIRKSVTISTAVNNPSITIKQPAKFNLFYKDSETVLTVTAKGLNVTDVKAAPGSTASFAIKGFDKTTGNLTMVFTEAYRDNGGKLNAKVNLLIYLEGYNSPITKAISVATVTTKPSISLTPASSVINTTLSSDHSALVRVYNKTEQIFIPIMVDKVDAAFATKTQEGDGVRLKLIEETGKINKGGTATVTVQPDNWMQAIKLSYEVTVQNVTPTVSFTESTVKLNRVHPSETAKTEVILSQSNLSVDSITLQPVVKNNAQMEDIYKIGWMISGNQITFCIQNPDDMPKSGTYEFRCTVRTGGIYPPINTIKVSVYADAPKVTLKSSTIKVNKLFDYTFNSDEMPKTALSMTNGAGYQLVNLEKVDSTHNDVDAFYNPEDGMIYPILMSDSIPDGTYTVKLRPWLLQESTDNIIVLPEEFYVNLTIQVHSTKPTVKLGKGTLTLNRVFSLQEDQTALTMSSVYAHISRVDFESTANAGTSTRNNADKIVLYYSDGQITAGMRYVMDVPAAGTYSYRYVVTLDNGMELAPQSIKVNVNSTLPTVKLNNGTMKLNKVLQRQAVMETGVVLTGNSEYVVEDLVPPDSWSSNDFSLSYSEQTGKLTVKLTNFNAEAKTHKIALTPVIRYADTGLRVYLSQKVNLNVQIYSGNLGISLAAKGKLDAVDRSSAITYTVNKLTNVEGVIDDVTLAGDYNGQPYEELFDAQLDNTGTKPTVTLTMEKDAVFATNVTYKPQLVFSICGKTITSTPNVKVSQSALKFASVPAVPVYQSQSSVLKVEVNLTSPANASIQEIRLNEKSSAQLLQALNASHAMTVINNKQSAVILFYLKDTGYMTYGKSYTAILDVIPEGCASNVKPTQVKVTVKAYQ